jgi:hypothetical protein
MVYFIFGYFSTKLGTSVDVHEKIITKLKEWTRVLVPLNTDILAVIKNYPFKRNIKEVIAIEINPFFIMLMEISPYGNLKQKKITLSVKILN